MYHDYYQLKEKPFQNTPNPGFLFLSSSHKEAMATITYGVDYGKGFIVILGEDGLGKTTLLHAYLNEMKRSEKKIICPFNGNFSFLELLKIIARKLELEVKGNESSLLLDIYEALIKKNEKGNQLVLLIDNAQDLSIENLERLRLFANIETPKEKLIQVILVGRPELECKLNLQELRQLKQRIVLKATLSPLKKNESLDYIHFRLERAGGQPSTIFTQKAMDKIVSYSNGIIRTINIICDNAMVMSHKSLQKKVSVRIVKEVIRNLDCKKNRFPTRLVSASLPSISLGLCLFVFFSFYNSLTANNDLNSSSLIGSKKPAQFFITEIIKKEMITPDRWKTLLNEKTNAIAAGNPSLINGLQVANEKPLIGKKASKLKGNKERFPIIAIVRKGDNIYRLTLNVYGFSNQKLLKFVKKFNPNIKENNEIRVGEKLIFPYWEEKKEGRLVEMDQNQLPDPSKNEIYS